MRLYNANCLSVLPSLPDQSVDMVLCDPPYGIDYSNHRRSPDKRFAPIPGDRRPFTEFVCHLPRLLKPSGCVCIFSRWDVQHLFMAELVANGLPVRSCVIWDKGDHGMGDLVRTFAPRYETILFSPLPDFRFANGRPEDIIRCRRLQGAECQHPTQKPVQLL